MLDDEITMESLVFEANKGRKPNSLEKVKMGVSILCKNMVSKLKETAAVISGKKLANNKEYEGTSRVTQEMVEAEPRKWIIEECVPACQILWDKNIYTFMCSDGLDIDTWIELEVDNLSPENIAILDEIRKEYVCYQYHQGCLNISVPGKGRKAQEELIKIAERFKMQDVPSDYATLSMKSIYMICGCSKEVENPNYVPIEVQLANMDFSNWSLDIQEPTIMVLDESKIVKSDEEYIDEVGAIRDSETGIIYRNQFHYNKHLKYLESLDKQKGLK